MCTGSWLTRGDGHDLFFNRDESKTRREAQAPGLAERDGVRFLAPVDADAGGTWIGVNEFGLTLGLLNAWQHPGGATSPRSRGLLVRDLLTAESAATVRARLDALDLGVYRGFRLLVLEPGRGPVLHAWDGSDRVDTRPAPPLSSSSLDGARATSERSRQFERVTSAGTVDELQRFHGSHEPERGPWSPCMHRDDASTVSATHVTVDAERAMLRYAPGPPCEAAFGEPLVLPRRAGAASPRG